MSTEKNGPLGDVSLSDILKIGGMIVAMAVGYATLQGGQKRNAEVIDEIKKENEKQSVQIDNLTSEMNAINLNLAVLTENSSHIRETLDELKPIIMDGIIK